MTHPTTHQTKASLSVPKISNFGPGAKRTEARVTWQNVIRRLEQAALDAYQTGQSWREFFASNTDAITAAIRTNPAGWSGLRDRLLSLLARGDTCGLRAAGDGDADEAQAVVVPAAVAAGPDNGGDARISPCLFSSATDQWATPPALVHPPGPPLRSLRGNRRRARGMTAISAQRSPSGSKAP